MNRLSIKIIILCASIMTVACNLFSGYNSFKSEKLNFPQAKYWRVGWLDNELVAFEDDPFLRVEIRYAKQGDDDFASIIIENTFLPNDPLCGPSIRHSIQDIVDNNTIQIQTSCYKDLTPSTYFSLYSWDTKKIEKTFGILPQGSTLSFWNPEKTIGLVYFSSADFKRTLYNLSSDNILAPLDIEISDEGSTWNTSDFYPDFPDIEYKTGNVGRADWSPNGESVVFFASPDAIGKTGFERMNARYKIYLMNMETQIPVPILDNIYLPYSMVWSPDSRYLVFMGDYERPATNKTSIFLYSFEDGSLTEIDSGHFIDVIWSPDSLSVIAIKCNGIFECKNTDIIKYDISAIAN